LMTHPHLVLGLQKESNSPIHPIWDFMTSYRVNFIFTFYLLIQKLQINLSIL